MRQLLARISISAKLSISEPAKKVWSGFGQDLENEANGASYIQSASA
jgi:hypothetical protein